MRMNVPLDMRDNPIINSPSIKPQIFALSGVFSNKILYGNQLQSNSKYVYFGRTYVIIAPVKCRMTKCFFTVRLV